MRPETEQSLRLATRPRARPGTRQAEKADETRQQILAAAVECLAKVGYAGITMTGIARQADISRGAMQYHFDNMRDVLRGTVAYIHEKRLSQLATHTGGALAEATQAVRFADRVDAHWAFLNSPVSIAFFELCVAARTDDVLADMLQPAHDRFWQEWVRLALETFPEWRGRQAELELACSLAQTLLEGLAIRRWTNQTDNGQGEALRSYLSDRIMDIFEHGDRNVVKPRVDA